MKIMTPEVTVKHRLLTRGISYKGKLTLYPIKVPTGMLTKNGVHSGSPILKKVSLKVGRSIIIG